MLRISIASGGYEVEMFHTLSNCCTHAHTPCTCVLYHRFMYIADDGDNAAAQPNKEEEATGSSSDYGKAMAKLKSGEQKKRTPKVSVRNCVLCM